jgi:hypothetical protein
MTCFGDISLELNAHVGIDLPNQFAMGTLRRQEHRMSLPFRAGLSNRSECQLSVSDLGSKVTDPLLTVFSLGFEGISC